MSGTAKAKLERKPKLALTVQYGVTRATPSRFALRRWASAALSRDANITLRIVGMREARALNRRFRRRDYATNVLSFEYSARPSLVGDVAICAPVVAREARERGISRDSHFAHLTVHGILHLQGHDHSEARDARKMEDLEARILAKLGYPDPYRSGKINAQ